MFLNVCDRCWCLAVSAVDAVDVVTQEAAISSVWIVTTLEASERQRDASWTRRSMFVQQSLGIPVDVGC
jgi:hypothetical protein